MFYKKYRRPPMYQAQVTDPETLKSLSEMTEFEKVKANHIPNVKSVLVVFSARGIAYDRDSLRHLITVSYPDAVVFFEDTAGSPMGPKAPGPVDLLLDFTGPGQQQGLFAARKYRGRARVCVGRNAGLFRKSVYDRVFDEKAAGVALPVEVTDRERMIQRKLLEMAGVAVAPAGQPTANIEHDIAKRLPYRGVKV